MDTMTCTILVAGSGGQGILFLGRLLASACMAEGKEVTWFPSYGAEVRGGTANCTVIVSRAMIGSPIVRNPDILIALNELSYARFTSEVRQGGALLYDSSRFTPKKLRRDIVLWAVPALSLAASCATPALANMVMLGALIAIHRITSIDSVLESLRSFMKEEKRHILELNNTAIIKGYEAFNDTKSPHQ